jgi:hypothetical protein
MNPSLSNNASLAGLFSRHGELLQKVFPDLPPDFEAMDFRSQLDLLQSSPPTEEHMKQIQAESELLFHVLGTRKMGICRHAKDTGVLAFANAPCRGNRIECQKVPGFVSYAKRCSPKECTYFERR